jgi:hypothetical protein
VPAGWEIDRNRGPFSRRDERARSDHRVFDHIVKQRQAVARIERSEIRERGRSSHAAPGFRCAQPRLHTRRKEGSGTPTDAVFHGPHQRVRGAPRECRLAPTLRCGRARLSAFHHGSHQRESSSLRLNFRPCFLGRGGACDPLVPCQGEDRTQFVRALPAPDLSQPSEHLAPRSVVPEGLMPEAAREWSASPPAGTALAPTFGMPPEGVLVGEIRFAMGM